MFQDSSLMKTQYLLQKGLDTAVLRRQVIADNVANADTPHFKRSGVTFEAQLHRALESANIEPFPVALTHKQHIPFFRPLDYRQVKAKIHTEYYTNYRNDKNNIDIEKEMADAAKNNLRFMAMSQRISQNFQKLQSVLK